MCTKKIIIIIKKRTGKEYFANMAQTSVNTDQTFPLRLKLSVTSFLQVSVAVFFCLPWYVEGRLAQSECVGGEIPFLSLTLPLSIQPLE